MSVESYRESPGKFDSRTLNRKTRNRWTGRTPWWGVNIFYGVWLHPYSGRGNL